jgi:sensor domain CHASE-containing protein
MDSVQVVLLALAGLVVGILCTVMIQVWFTLRQLQQEIRETRQKVDPMLDEMRTLLNQIRSATHVASAVAMAVTAGVQAWRQSRSNEADAETT